MDLSRGNNYSIADNTVLNVTSLMECTDAQRLSMDEMTFGEFSSTNIPTLIKGSQATVNGALFGPAASDGVPLYIANAAGSTFQDVSAAPADTTLYLCLVPGTDTATYALKACASVYYNAERRGWYETGSQVRVFGECRKVSGSWPVKYKRRYYHPSVIEGYIKMYSDGLEINARKINPIYREGIIAGNVKSASINKNYSLGSETLFKVRVDYPIVLRIRLEIKTWKSGGSGNVTISGCSIQPELLEETHVAPLGTLPETQITNVASSGSSTSGKAYLVQLFPGAYNININTVIDSFTEYSSGGGNATTYQKGLYVARFDVDVCNVAGDRTGSTWGAIL